MMPCREDSTSAKGEKLAEVTNIAAEDAIEKGIKSQRWVK